MSWQSAWFANFEPDDDVGYGGNVWTGGGNPGVGNLVAKPEICSRIHLLWFGGNLGEEVEIEYNHMFENAIASKAKNRRDSGWEEQVGIWMRTDANKEIIYLPFSLDILSEIYQTTFFYYMIYIYIYH